MFGRYFRKARRRGGRRRRRKRKRARRPSLPRWRRCVSSIRARNLGLSRGQLSVGCRFWGTAAEAVRSRLGFGRCSAVPGLLLWPQTRFWRFRHDPPHLQNPLRNQSGSPPEPRNIVQIRTRSARVRPHFRLLELRVGHGRHHYSESDRDAAELPRRITFRSSGATGSQTAPAGKQSKEEALAPGQAFAQRTGVKTDRRENSLLRISSNSDMIVAFWILGGHGIQKSRIFADKGGPGVHHGAIRPGAPCL